MSMTECNDRRPEPPTRQVAISRSSRSRLAALVRDLVHASENCHAIGRGDEAHRLARAARKLTLVAAIPDILTEIEPKRI